MLRISMDHTKEEANFRGARTLQIFGEGNGLLSLTVGTCAYNCNICVLTKY